MRKRAIAINDMDEKGKRRRPSWDMNKMFVHTDTYLLLYLCTDRPVTYLYNTLHYYERHLRDRTNLKRKLVHAIMSSLKVGRGR